MLNLLVPTWKDGVLKMALLTLSVDEVMLEVQNNHLKNLAPIGIFCLQVKWNRPEEDKVWYYK